MYLNTHPADPPCKPCIRDFTQLTVTLLLHLVIFNFCSACFELSTQLVHFRVARHFYATQFGHEFGRLLAVK
jgi:hypothetical protein